MSPAMMVGVRATLSVLMSDMLKWSLESVLEILLSDMLRWSLESVLEFLLSDKLRWSLESVLEILLSDMLRWRLESVLEYLQVLYVSRGPGVDLQTCNPIIDIWLILYMNFRSHRWGPSLPGLRRLDPPFAPPST